MHRIDLLQSLFLLLPQLSNLLVAFLHRFAISLDTLAVALAGAARTAAIGILGGAQVGHGVRFLLLLLLLVRLGPLLPLVLHTSESLHLFLQPSLLSFEHAKGIRDLSEQGGLMRWQVSGQPRQNQGEVGEDQALRAGGRRGFRW